MTGETLKEKLHNGERVYGTHIASMMNPLAAAIATSLELDFAFICTEHMPVDRTEVSMMCQFYKAHGISPIVRVTDPNPTAISMATDAGPSKVNSAMTLSRARRPIRRSLIAFWQTLTSTNI